MSNISEQRALEVYPKALSPYYGDDILDRNINCRAGYVKGYDQAMQDFMEKAEKWLEPTLKNLAGYNCGGDLINDFKTYMEEEL